jgi:WD40 repeat protein
VKTATMLVLLAFGQPGYAVVLLVGVALFAGGRCQAQEPKLRATLEGHSYPVLSVTFSPDNRMVASASADQTIKLWEVATGKIRATLKGCTNGPNWPAFSPDGKTLTLLPDDPTIQLWDLATGKEPAIL